MSASVCPRAPAAPSRVLVLDRPDGNTTADAAPWRSLDIDERRVYEEQREKPQISVSKTLGEVFDERTSSGADRIGQADKGSSLRIGGRVRRRGFWFAVCLLLV